MNDIERGRVPGVFNVKKIKRVENYTFVVFVHRVMSLLYWHHCIICFNKNNVKNAL